MTPNELTTLPASELQKICDDRDKFMWQVRDTCARAEKAEARIAELEAENARLREALETTRDYVADTASGGLTYDGGGEGLSAMAKDDLARIDTALSGKAEQ